MSDDVAAWIAAGLYDPSAPNAADQLDLLRFLTGHGATVDDMVAAVATNSLIASASDLLLAEERTISRDDMAVRSGLTVDQIDRAWLSLGLPPVEADGPVFSGSDLLLFQAFALGVGLLGFDAALQLTRVMGSSLARIADAAASGFLVNVEGPLVDENSPPVVLAKASYDATGILASLPQIFAPIFLRHSLLATMRTRVSRDASRGYAEFRLTVGFLDLVDFTTWSRELPVRELARAVNDFEEAASDLITERGARVVKNIGDAVMFVAFDPRVACDIALDLCAYVDKHPTLTQLRGAVATGPLLSRDGDYFGPTVNLAARAVKLAEPGEVVSDQAIEGLEGRALGHRDVRGFDDPVELFALRRP